MDCDFVWIAQKVPTSSVQRSGKWKAGDIGGTFYPCSGIDVRLAGPSTEERFCSMQINKVSPGIRDVNVSLP